MKRTDFYFLATIVALFLPFFVSETLYAKYSAFNASHAMVMSFLKFGILSTLGEMLGCRIAKGIYIPKGFGIIPRMVVWGFLGMGINMAMIIFSKGTPLFMEAMGMTDVVANFVAPGFNLQKFLVAVAISTTMNCIFAPVFMTLHKVTDAHIATHGGALRSLITPIQMGKLLGGINWNVQWGFVFKKTIPYFWIPAHTITFLLNPELRVLFAALLGVALGALLAFAAKGAK